MKFLMATFLPQETYSHVFCIKTEFHGPQATRESGNIERKGRKDFKKSLSQL